MHFLTRFDFCVHVSSKNAYRLQMVYALYIILQLTYLDVDSSVP